MAIIDRRAAHAECTELLSFVTGCCDESQKSASARTNDSARFVGVLDTVLILFLC
jgi:hypothetical protein